MRSWLALSIPLMFAAGCTPAVTLGAHAIHTAQAADSKETWIYLQSADEHQTGVYRCADGPQGPVCRKAKLLKD